jgi:ABC-2 type transport system ATP-binding protein
MNVIECKGLSKIYGGKKALDEISFSIEENKITGLIGRNGAGKTTLLKIITGLIKETSGDVHVFAEKPFNSLKVSANTIFIDDNMVYPSSLNLADILQSASMFYPNWDMDLAERLFNYFSLHPRLRYQNLSKGMKSTFNMIVGLSARCPLTIFDEPTSGMDHAVRQDFYRAILKDYIDYPRTIVLSSHLLGEIENILENILLVKDGKNLLYMSVEDLKEFAIGIKGNAEIVAELVKNKELIHQKNIGVNSSFTVVKNDFTEADRQKARLNGLELTKVPTDELCVYLTSRSKGGIDDVFSRG